jgi:hypothetical protein
LKPDGQIVINGTKNNQFSILPNEDVLNNLGLRVVHSQVPLLPEVQGHTFRYTDGAPITKEVLSKFLEKVK